MTETVETLIPTRPSHSPLEIETVKLKFAKSAMIHIS